MKKRLCCLTDFVIWGEDTETPYVDWATVKEVLGNNDYRKLIKFLVTLRVRLPREGLPIKYLKQFLESLQQFTS